MNEISKNCKNVEWHKLTRMVETYLWEEMCQLCTFIGEKYKEAKIPFKINHRWKEILNMTLEDEVPKALQASRWLVHMSTSWEHNFCIQYPFGVIGRPLERYRWEVQFLMDQWNPMAIISPLFYHKNII